MVDMSTAVIIREGKSLDATVDLMRQTALKMRLWVVCFRASKGSAFPVLECNPQGDVAEVMTPTFRVSLLDSMHARYMDVAERMMAAFEADQTKRFRQLRKTLMAYNRVALAAGAAMPKVDGVASPELAVA